tara:strand:- start:43 stop:333 length:291 start_codon:yes stop_codon:yes gene_type:complete
VVSRRWNVFMPPSVATSTASKLGGGVQRNRPDGSESSAPGPISGSATTAGLAVTDVGLAAVGEETTGCAAACPAEMGASESVRGIELSERASASLL